MEGLSNTRECSRTFFGKGAVNSKDVGKKRSKRITTGKGRTPGYKRYEEKGIGKRKGEVIVTQVMKDLCKRLGITPKLSTVHHLQTDGQTKLMN